MTTRFTPRQTRALEMLKPGHWITREHLDREAGASNSPDLIQQLRGKLGRDGTGSKWSCTTPPTETASRRDRAATA
jgi:hypothetical protein